MKTTKIRNNKEMQINEQALISVIVPVYNVKDYIEECIDSIIMQSYTKLEIVLIDDGSTDGSGEVCDRYSEKDNRVVTYHKKNEGLSSARNYGIDICKGDYIAFVDSDDYIETSFIETMFYGILKTNADICFCHYYFGKANGIKKKCKKIVKRIEKYDSNKILKEWHGKRTKIETIAWNKLYRRNLFDKEGLSIRYPIGRLHEDIVMTHLLVSKASSIAIVPDYLYCYRKRKGSITLQKNSIKKTEDSNWSQIQRLTYFKEHKFNQAYNRLYIAYIKNQMINILKNICK